MGLARARTSLSRYRGAARRKGRRAPLEKRARVRAARGLWRVDGEVERASQAGRIWEERWAADWAGGRGGREDFEVGGCEKMGMMEA